MVVLYRSRSGTPRLRCTGIPSEDWKTENKPIINRTHIIPVIFEHSFKVWHTWNIFCRSGTLLAPMYSIEAPDPVIILVGVAKINVEASVGTLILKPWNQITFSSYQLNVDIVVQTTQLSMVYRFGHGSKIFLANKINMSSLMSLIYVWPS